MLALALALANMNARKLTKKSLLDLAAESHAARAAVSLSFDGYRKLQWSSLIHPRVHGS
jgi:hypothetical protein